MVKNRIVIMAVVLIRRAYKGALVHVNAIFVWYR